MYVQLPDEDKGPNNIGDDFVAIGDPKHPMATNDALHNKYDIKIETLACSIEDKKGMRALNKVGRITSNSKELEADPSMQN